VRSWGVGVPIGMAVLVLGAFVSVAPAAEPGSGTVAAPASAAAATEAPKTAPQVALVRVQLHTELGDIVLGLDPQHAPITSANFLSYVDQKRFDGSTFYRAVKLDEEGHSGLVQGGLRGDPERALPPIAHEAPNTTGLKHVDGAISMARAEPGTATADFFIVMGDLPSLDGQPGSDVRDMPCLDTYSRAWTWYERFWSDLVTRRRAMAT
jgi:peptidyl-prolyl cis-trans isomerase A (cyclophilin A)